MHLPYGTLLKGGTYKIERLIDSDGFSCWYEAVHLTMNKEVTVYEYFPKGLCDRDWNTHDFTVWTDNRKAIYYDRAKLKFLKEARLLAQLSHPSILQTTDVFEENNTAYYVTGFIKGESLKKRLSERRVLNENETLQYIRQVCDALAYLHQNNYLHLDIKPGNIIIDSNGRAFLINFITSKHYNEYTGEVTSSVLEIKTFGYSSLEQEGNDISHFRPATDIYSLGATLYECFKGETPMRATERAQGVELQPLPITLSLSTKKAIYAALQLSYNDRPQSIQEFLSILDPNNTPKEELKAQIASSNVNSGVGKSIAIEGGFVNSSDNNNFFTGNNSSNNSISPSISNSIST